MMSLLAASLLTEVTWHEDDEDATPLPPLRSADCAVKGLQTALEYYNLVGNKLKTQQLKSMIRDRKK